MILTLRTVLGVAILLLGLALPPGAATPEVTVLSTASIKGVMTGGDRPDLGGFHRFATYLAMARERGPVLLVDGGDFSAGRNFRGPVNGFVWGLMGELGYDAATPGITELELGSRVLRDLMGDGEIHVVSANVRGPRGHLLFPESVVLERGGVRFGITGVTEPAFHRYSRKLKRLQVDDLQIEPVEDALRRVVPKLRRRADVVVVLLHSGPQDSRRVVESIPGIDLVVVSHNPGFERKTTGNPPQIRSGAYLRYVGRAVVTTEPVAVHSPARLIPLDIEIAPDTEIAEQIETFRTRMRSRRNLASVQRIDNRQSRDVFAGIDQKQARRSTRVGPRTGVISTQGPLGRVEPPATWVINEWKEDGDPLQINIPGSRSSYRIVWKGQFQPTPPTLAAWIEQGAPIALLNLHPLVPGDSSGIITVPSGSKLEQTCCRLFRIYAATYLSGPEVDLRTGSLLVGDADQALRDLAPTARNAVLLEALARRLERQADFERNAYWQRRAVIYLDLVCDSTGAVTGVGLLENNHRPEAVEPLEATVREWRLPTPDWRRQKPQPFHVVAAFPMDRHETDLERALAGFPGDSPGRIPARGARLPEPVRKALTEEPSLADWTRVWSVDPEFSLEDFISPGVEEIPQQISLDSDTDLAARALADGWTYATAWVGDQLVVAGTSLIKHSRFSNGSWGHIQVPTVWIADRAEGTLRRYQGVPAPPTAYDTVRKALARLEAP